MENEKRLIEANEFKMRLEEIRQECLEEDTYSSNFAAEVIETVQDEYLANAPTVDAVEVVHGRWEEHPRDTYAKEHHCEKLRCTHCWHFFYHNYGDGKMYCPNCGAKMDGGML